MAFLWSNASKRCRGNCKQCRPWSDCSSRSSLIWVCTVCSDLSVWKLRKIMVRPICPPMLSMEQVLCKVAVNFPPSDSGKWYSLLLPVYWADMCHFCMYGNWSAPSTAQVGNWVLYSPWLRIWAVAWQNQQNDCAPNEESDQRLRCALNRLIRLKAFFMLDSEVSEQTGQMPRLIWVFAGRTWHFVGFVMKWLTYQLSIFP